MKDNNYYKFFKALLMPLFKIFYKPQVHNKELIPEKGAIIVCGNHIHILDQCFPILATKRVLHYMAKKEYFDSKFAWFFRKAGCISVDRKVRDDDAKQEAMKVLNSGKALGIFPEGTRNSIVCKKEKLDELYEYVKDEICYKKFKKILKKNLTRASQTDLLIKLLKNKKIKLKDFKKYVFDANESLKELVRKKVITHNEYKESLLLPIKFGTVSMAQKSGATIVPYVITGFYKRGKAKVTILKPFKVGKDDDLEKANNFFKKTMLDKLAEEQ
ncbi:MAG: 1-acyl-sn-glycerol-3-phosphate acyltransferase [Mollicutes bacterium]|nr:1-acyl-sn-glycerol-3-phosphate acyltransferase [Mollicutes bacterium]